MDWMEYEDLSEDEQGVVRETLCLLLNARWVDNSYLDNYVFIVQNGKLMDMNKKGDTYE